MQEAFLGCKAVIIMFMNELNFTWQHLLHECKQYMAICWWNVECYKFLDQFCNAWWVSIICLKHLKIFKLQKNDEVLQWSVEFSSNYNKGKSFGFSNTKGDLDIFTKHKTESKNAIGWSYTTFRPNLIIKNPSIHPFSIPLTGLDDLLTETRHN